MMTSSLAATGPPPQPRGASSSAVRTHQTAHLTPQTSLTIRVAVCKCSGRPRLGRIALLLCCPIRVAGRGCVRMGRCAQECADERPYTIVAR